TDVLWSTDLYRLCDCGPLDATAHGGHRTVAPCLPDGERSRRPDICLARLPRSQYHSSCTGPSTRPIRARSPGRIGIRAEVRILPRQTLRANRASPDPARKNREIRLPRRWRIYGALLRGARHGSTFSRLLGMFLLDPKAPGALLRRRLRVSNGGGGEGGDVVRDVRGVVTLSRGEDGIQFLCWPVPRRTVRAPGTRSVRQASNST